LRCCAINSIAVHTDMQVGNSHKENAALFTAARIS